MLMYNLEISQSFPRRFPLIVLVFLGESDVCKYIKLLLLLHDGNLYDPFLSWFYASSCLKIFQMTEKLLLESPEMHFILSCCTF